MRYAYSQNYCYLRDFEMERIHNAGNSNSNLIIKRIFVLYNLCGARICQYSLLCALISHCHSIYLFPRMLDVLDM
jgi:hypothetical protein